MKSFIISTKTLLLICGFSPAVSFTQPSDRSLNLRRQYSKLHQQSNKAIRKIHPSLSHQILFDTKLQTAKQDEEVEVPVDTETSTYDALDEIILKKFQKYNKEMKQDNLMTFTLTKFKPLGCTAEESLKIETDGSKHVFISKVVADGNAEAAGIQTGDVIVAVSGSFEYDVLETVGAGLDRVKGLIAGRDEGVQNLVLKVIRGSHVQSEHDSALVDLCVLPEKDTDVDKCIEAMYQADYDIRTSGGETINDENACDDEDIDCMLDAMLDVWGDEVGISTTEDEDKEEETKKNKPAPWSSRSSPSGTYVRDPKTGKMVNIDE